MSALFNLHLHKEGGDPMLNPRWKYDAINQAICWIANFIAYAVLEKYRYYLYILVKCPSGGNMSLCVFKNMYFFYNFVIKGLFI